MSDPIDLKTVPLEDIEEEIFRRAGNLMVLGSKKLTEAAASISRNDLDAEGPLADAIQHLTVALKMVRDLKKEKQRG